MIKTLKEFIELSNAATPGPWYSGTVNVYQTNHITRDVWNVAGPCLIGLSPARWEKDRPFIAESRILAPKMAKALNAVLEIAKEHNPPYPVSDYCLCPICTARKSIEEIMAGKT